MATDVGKKYAKIGDQEWVRDRILEAMRDGGYTQQKAEQVLNEYVARAILDSLDLKADSK